MPNDLVETLSAGEIAPYNEGMPVLAPLSPAPWGTTDVDLLREDHRQPQTLTFFGASLPSGTTEAQVQAALDDFGQRFETDFSSLGYPAGMTNFAIKFLKERALNPPRQVRANHNFELPSELSGDYLANDFCNRLEGLAGTIPQKVQFLNAALKWLAKQANHSSQVVGTEGASPTSPRMAHSTEVMLGQLSEADYNRVVATNNKAQAETMNRLAAKYGEHSAQQVVQLAQNYLNSLPANERAHFDQFTGNWVHAMNTPEVIEGLYNMAIGANSIGTNGVDIAREIAAFESMLKVPAERARYMKDPQMQARLRELYARRGN